jgi:transposase
MDRAWLEAQFAAGRSMEAIARELDKDPSTIAYWAQQLDLRSPYAGRHASRGGLAQAELEALVARDLPVRAIAAQLDRSVGTVRYWMQRYGLKTTAAARRRTAPPDRPERVRLRCQRHGEVEFVLRRSEGRYRCTRCSAEAVADWRRRAKALLVHEAGGRCRLCGYDRCTAALQFHHVDPRQKRFGVAGRGVARSRAALRAEARKCVLLCANCHAEVEAGFTALPGLAAPDDLEPVPATPRGGLEPPRLD